MKKLAFLAAFLVACLVTSRADATLFNYYSDKGLNLPSVSERIPLAEQCGISNYIGTASQNIALEECLRGAELGGASPVAGSTYTLAGSGVSASASSITLTSFTIPQTGYELQDSDFGDTFYLTLEPGSTKRQEIVSCTTVTQNAGDTATLSGCSRGLLPFGTYAASSTYAFAHSGGSSVILSDAPQLFNLYVSKASAESITGAHTYYDFPSYATSTDCPTANGEFTTKYCSDLAGASGFTDANISSGYGLILVTTTPVAQVGVDTSTLFALQARTSTIVSFDCDNALSCVTTSSVTVGFKPKMATFIGAALINGEAAAAWYGKNIPIQGYWIDNYQRGVSYTVSSTAAGTAVSYSGTSRMWAKGDGTGNDSVMMKINTTSATGISYVITAIMSTTSASNTSVDGVLIIE
jgi:hypothetical protein